MNFQLNTSIHYSDYVKKIQKFKKKLLFNRISTEKFMEILVEEIFCSRSFQR